MGLPSKNPLTLKAAMALENSSSICTDVKSDVSLEILMNCLNRSVYVYLSHFEVRSGYAIMVIYRIWRPQWEHTSSLATVESSVFVVFRISYRHAWRDIIMLNMPSDKELDFETFDKFRMKTRRTSIFYGDSLINRTIRECPSFRYLFFAVALAIRLHKPELCTWSNWFITFLFAEIS